MVVKVNGREVTDEQVAAEVGRLTQQLSTRATPEQLEEMGAAIRKQAVENIVRRLLFEDAADVEGITISDESIDARISEIKEGFPSEEVFAQRLGEIGVTEDELRKDLESSMRVEALLAKHTGDIAAASEKEIADFYAASSHQFDRPERIRASHILIATDEGASAPKRAEKRMQAARVLGILEEGADFSQLATQKSECPSRSRGGDLGFFERGQMIKEFEDAAFALDVGEVSGIVETKFGYHIIKVTGHEDAHTVPLDEVKDQIAAFLDSKKKQAAVDDYAESLRSEAAIEYGDPSLAP